MKEVKEIYEQMLAVFGEKTGISAVDSADLAVRLYAAAAELETLYGYCDWALGQSFPQTATGEYLTLHAQLRGLERRGAGKAVGELQFSVDEALADDVLIPKGTVATDAGLVRFVTTEAAVIPAGSLSCTVPAEAETAGVGGNAAGGTVTKMPQPPAYVTGCVNPAPFTGGSDQETDEALRQRVLKSFSRLPNGANAAFYEERVRAFDGVAGVSVLPRNRGVGTVDIVVSSPAGVPEDSLLEDIRADIQNVREIAVDVSVLPPETVPVTVGVTLWPAEAVSGQEAVAAVQEAVEKFFEGGLLGKNVYLAELGSVIFATGMVRNFVLTKPTRDVSVTASQLPVLKSLTVTEGE